MAAAVFRRLEIFHGKLLTSATLGLLSAARDGLTRAELLHVLSADDEVLSDVLQVGRGYLNDEWLKAGFIISTG